MRVIVTVKRSEVIDQHIAEERTEVLIRGFLRFISECRDSSVINVQNNLQSTHPLTLCSHHNGISCTEAFLNIILLKSCSYCYFF
jgi:hypothetical protein